MEIRIFTEEFTVCKVNDISEINLKKDLIFLARTEEEISVVCRRIDVPERTIDREDGWRLFQIAGMLEFGMIGIIARISKLLADAEISIFVVSTYNTDYFLVKEDKYLPAQGILRDAGYSMTSH